MALYTFVHCNCRGLAKRFSIVSLYTDLVRRSPTAILPRDLLAKRHRVESFSRDLEQRPPRGAETSRKRSPKMIASALENKHVCARADLAIAVKKQPPSVDEWWLINSLIMVRSRIMIVIDYRYQNHGLMISSGY